MIDISSLTSIYPLPVRELYATTKHFNKFLNIGFGYKYTDIQFLTVKPGYVQSQFNDYRPLDNLTITGQQCAAFALKNLGVVKELFGPKPHVFTGLLVELMTSIPVWLIMPFEQRLRKLFKDRKQDTTN